MIPQNPIHPFRKEVPHSADRKCETDDADMDSDVSKMITAPSDSSSDTSDTALQVKKLWCCPLSPSESAPQVQSNKRLLDSTVRYNATPTFPPSHKPCVCTYLIVPEENYLSQLQTKRAILTWVEVLPSAIFCVLYEAASEVLLDGRYRPQVLCDL